MRWLALVFARVTLVFFAAQMMVLAGTRLAYPGEYVDPFTLYEAMMPGQRVMASKNYPCTCPIKPDHVESCRCEIHSADGPFMSVIPSVFDGWFDSIVFIPNHLYVGDIIRHWGRPDLLEKQNSFFVAIWSEQGLYGVIDSLEANGRFSYMMRVAQLIIGPKRDKPVLR